MSELKAYSIPTRSGNSCHCYLKSEVDKVMDEKDAAIRRLKRALYKACANWAFLAQWERGELVENWEKWENVERKCIKKAGEFK